MSVVSFEKHFLWGTSVNFFFGIMVDPATDSQFLIKIKTQKALKPWNLIVWNLDIHTENLKRVGYRLTKQIHNY